MNYGQLPKNLGVFEVPVKEMMFYQYLPIKMAGEIDTHLEKRLEIFKSLIGVILCDYIGQFGLNNFVDSYVYVTAKNMWQGPNCSFNRLGWHSDGFLTNDINYVWCNCKPTVYNNSTFNITPDDNQSLKEMEEQALPENDVTYPDNSLLRLNQYVIHKVGEYDYGCMRAFLKVSISKDKYDLEGNSVNHLIDYNWEMRPRCIERNIPQELRK